MNRSLACLAVLISFAVACNQAKSPVIPVQFKTESMELIEGGAKLDQLAKQGVSLKEFQDNYVAVRSSFETVRYHWPLGFALEARTNLEQSIKGWDYALALWELEVGKKTTGDKDNYNEIRTYSDNKIQSYEAHRLNGVQKDEVAILMGLASSAFTAGRTELLNQLSSTK